MQTDKIKSSGFLALAMVALGGTAGTGQVLVPDYNLGTVFDAVTGPNVFQSSNGDFHWYVDTGADDYFADQYERPFNQSFAYYDDNGVTRYATNSDYFGNLDIESGSLGITEQFLYARMTMWDTKEYGADGSIDDEGLVYFYRLRFDDLLLSAEQPGKSGTTWQLEKNSIFQDTTGQPLLGGNGYNTQVADDGELYSTDAPVLYTRIAPDDARAVEFAFDFTAFGYQMSDILDLVDGLVFEANKGLLDPQNYPWNEKYSPSEAGSPNGGVDGKSEFGTQGLGNIYELDTMIFSFSQDDPPITPVPEPSTYGMIGALLLAALVAHRRYRGRLRA